MSPGSQAQYQYMQTAMHLHEHEAVEYKVRAEEGRDVKVGASHD